MALVSMPVAFRPKQLFSELFATESPATASNLEDRPCRVANSRGRGLSKVRGLRFCSQPASYYNGMHPFVSSPSARSHKKQAANRGPVCVAVVTVSDTRTPETDVNGRYLIEQIEASGNHLHSTAIVRDEPEQVANVLDRLASDNDVQVIFFNGGTGISQRDRTFDVLNAKLEKTLPGFGELFRMLSWEQVGSAAMMSRATAGVYCGKIVFSTPGSPAAVRLAWEKLIEPELSHLAWELVR